MGLFTDARRALTRLWGRTEQAVGEAYGNQALEYEGTADEARVDAEQEGNEPRREHRRHLGKPGDEGDEDDQGDGGARVPAR